MCVGQDFCDALAAIAGNPAKTLRLAFDGCPETVVGGNAFLANLGGTVFKAKSPAEELPAYSIKISCRALEAIVKLRWADLQGCVTNPVRVTLSAQGARALAAEAQFTELRDADGDLRSLVFLSTESCS